jgi:hypothetical protein
VHFFAPFRIPGESTYEAGSLETPSASDMTENHTRYFIIARAGRQWLADDPPAFYAFDGDAAPVVFDDKDDAIRALSSLRPDDGRGATVLEVELQSSGDGKYAVIIPPEYLSKYDQ